MYYWKWYSNKTDSFEIGAYLKLSIKIDKQIFYWYTLTAVTTDFLHLVVVNLDTKPPLFQASWSCFPTEETDIGLEQSVV